MKEPTEDSVMCTKCGHPLQPVIISIESLDPVNGASGPTVDRCVNPKCERNYKKVEK